MGGSHSTVGPPLRSAYYTDNTTTLPIPTLPTIPPLHHRLLAADCARRAWMDIDAEHIRPLALQQPRDELACIASPPPVVTSHTRARERLDALVAEKSHGKHSASAAMPLCSRGTHTPTRAPYYRLPSPTHARTHLVEEVDAEHVRAGGVHLLEAEQVGRDARAQARFRSEGGEEDLLVVDPAADAPVGGELAW